MLVSLSIAVTASAAHWGPYQDEAFEIARRADHVILLQFVERGCGPCEEQERALSRMFLASPRRDLAGFQVDINRRADLTRGYAVTSPSTLVLLRGMHETARSVRLITEPELTDLLAKADAPVPRGRPPARPRSRFPPHP